MSENQYEKFILPNLEKIVQLNQQGVNIKDIAAAVGVSRDTFWRYMKKGREGDERYKPLYDAFTQASEVPNEKVKNALFRSATGYNAKILKHYKIKTVEFDPDTGKKIREKEVLKEAYDEVHVPANVSAQMFWLTNRAPEEWAYKPAPGETDDDGTGVVMMPEVKGSPALR